MFEYQYVIRNSSNVGRLRLLAEEEWGEPLATVVTAKAVAEFSLPPLEVVFRKRKHDTQSGYYHPIYAGRQSAAIFLPKGNISAELALHEIAHHYHFKVLLNSQEAFLFYHTIARRNWHNADFVTCLDKLAEWYDTSF